MKITPNHSLIEKAALTIADLTADGGLLVPAQARRFIEVLIKQSRIMQDAVVRPMASDKELIETIRFGSRVLRPGAEATALPEADRVKPDLTKVELDSELFKGEAPVSEEVFEDNIEGAALQNRLMQLLTKAVSRDMEEVLIQGDTASADTFLAVLDGLLKQATSNVVDATNSTLSKTELKAAWKTMPLEFRRMKASMRYYTSPNAESDYGDTVADRATGAGDAALQAAMDQKYTGIPVVGAAMFPETVSGPDTLTQMLLTDPENIRVGIRRKIRVRVHEEPRSGLVFLLVDLRFDVKYVTETAVVKVTNIKVN